VPGQTATASEGIPVMCGPRGLRAHEYLYHNNAMGRSPMYRRRLHPEAGPRYSITAVSYDFDNDGWPDIYVRLIPSPASFS